MWFKNLIFYRFSKPFDMSQDKFEQALQEFAFKPCGSQDVSQYGWTTPLGHQTDGLVHAGSGCYWITAKKEEKMLPAPVIKEMVEEKAEKISEAEQRKVSNKEKQQLKEEVVMTLLPRAFSRFSSTSAYIDTKEGLLVVDAASFNKAEDLMALLRKTLGSLPVLPVEVMEAPGAIMNKWLLENFRPAQFTITEEAELAELGEDGAVAKFKRQPLDSDEVLAHIEAGKQVVKLSMMFDDRIEFLLHDDLTVKRIKFTELVTDENEDVGTEDPIARLDADFTLMCAELAAFIKALLNAFGGELLPEQR
ncbi:recombination-associated protein RdgC [Echinimonas agarilytica]|uniref:Recombination-associated protein RdgC n=1 Tax=Echinimonas agarilytica TaxID=1215918 RepID=A0AA41W7T3_9GAMM|nr:recombination-associated protein RdgC [Echinimonas agarilytica]MCM2680188.1 recombination-associated protein RdgC [Echinimonas agarilytica]